ncbi:MAG: hypothetical protein II836_00375 [Clostridia bacterium]|nr:hypothetical protein [Clostridia bacterium]
MSRRNNLLAVISREATAGERARLEREYETVSLPPDPALPPSAAHRPDILFAALGDALIFSRAYRDRFPDPVESLAERTGMRLILSDAPRDVRLGDAVLWRDRLVESRTPLLFPELADAAREAGIGSVRVRAKHISRSCLVCGDALLTSGYGICAALSPLAKDVWFCPDEGIRGGIGGASGAADGVVFFFGDPSSMEYAETLSRFLDHAGLDFVLLDESHPLTDRGGIRFLNLKT